MGLEHHPDVFPKEQVLKLFSLTRRMLSYWEDHVFVRTKASKHGSFNFHDLCMVASIVHLRKRMFSIQRIRKEIMPEIEQGVRRAKSGGKSITDLKLTVWKNTVFIHTGEVYSQVPDWHKDTLDFRDVWNSVRAVKIKMQEFKEDFD